MCSLLSVTSYISQDTKTFVFNAGGGGGGSCAYVGISVVCLLCRPPYRGGKFTRYS
jgi:hypothetical protein